MPPHDAEDFREKQYDVLVSYQRADDDQRRELVEALEARGYEVFWDGKLGPDYWRIEWRNRLKQCRLMVVLWSVTAAKSDEVKDEAGGAKAFEKCLSVPLDGVGHVPKPYLETNRQHWDRKGDTSRRQAQLKKVIDKVAKLIGPPRGLAAPQSGAVIPVEWGDIPGAPPHLVGRDSEMAMLRQAWDSRAPQKVNAVVLHALGGAGKSALLRTFANQLLAAGGAGARRIYGWSAYSQGSGEQKRADADSFISRALVDFGWNGKLPGDPIERARELAKLIQKERVLLLLDGLEPLQDPPGVNKGRFKDKGLAELVRSLASQNSGLVVLTTRQEVPELQGHGPLVINYPLDQLSDQAGADLLVELGVRGRQRELEAAVRSVDGHALSVTVLGTYLSEVCGGDIRHRDQFDFADIVLTQAEQEELATDKTIIPAKRAAKVMRGYLEQFDKLAADGAAAGLGGPERSVLHLIGLFDRPADGAAVDALLAQHIPGLTDELFFDSVAKTSGWWLFKSHKIEMRPLDGRERAQRIRRAKERLRKLRLLSKPNPKDPQELDAHPIVRAYFSGRLEETAPEAAKAAHEILFAHYASAAPDLPTTLDDMQPLFHAVQHGVKAGRAREVYEKIFHRRIMRGSDFYMFRSLGAFGPCLAIMANFFETPWRSPRADIGVGNRSWVFSGAAYALRALGRLDDSIAPSLAGLDDDILKEDWANAAVGGGNIADTLLTLGRVTEAVPVAEAAIAHADLSQDDSQRALRRTDLAAALTQAGDLERAATLFAEAEQIGADRGEDPAQLVSLQGYQYGDLILARGDAAEALNRGRYQLEIAERYLGKGMGLHNIGYGHLLIGRAQDTLGKTEAAASLDAAVAGLRKSGMTDELPRALLARVEHRRRRAAGGDSGLIAKIREDLAEAADISGNEMRLYLTDLALENARLALDVPAAFASPQAARAEAEAQAQRAVQLIDETGYHRRDPELARIRTRLVAAA